MARSIREILADALGGDNDARSDVQVAADAARQLRDLRKAALAYRDLATCYRTGRAPSEALHARLDMANAVLARNL